MSLASHGFNSVAFAITLVIAMGIHIHTVVLVEGIIIYFNSRLSEILKGERVLI